MTEIKDQTMAFRNRAIVERTRRQHLKQRIGARASLSYTEQQGRVKMRR
jgi:hypothetical protein